MQCTVYLVQCTLCTVSPPSRRLTRCLFPQAARIQRPGHSLKLFARYPQRVIPTDKMDPDKSRNCHFSHLANILVHKYIHFLLSLLKGPHIYIYIYPHSHTLGKTTATLGSKFYLLIFHPIIEFEFSTRFMNIVS